jgi:L-cysteine desulfidase
VALASGIAYYLIEDNTEESKKIKIIGSAINNIIGDITGIICDGAKKTCSLKAITAVDAAITSAFLALNGIEMLHDLGVVNKNPLFSIKNIGIISKGMKETDKKIIKEILNKNFSKYLKSRN